MFLETSPQGMPFSNNHYEVERRRTARRQEDRLLEEAHQEKARKLHSLLELGQIVGLDLQLDEMLLQFAQKATDWSYRLKVNDASIFQPIKMSVREKFLPVSIVKPRRIVYNQEEAFSPYPFRG